MAKVTGPLLSLGASGQIAKTLVYMRWKGIDDVRQYVIPTNPQTAPQITQRGYFEDGVDEWHLTKYTAADKTAWDKYAAILAKPMSGFNAFVKSWIERRLAGVAVPDPPYAAYLLSGGAGLFDCGIAEDGEAAAAYADWGYSPTAMNTRVALAEAPANEWTAAGIAATVGAKVYVRFATWGAGDYLGYSGIKELTIV